MLAYAASRPAPVGRRSSPNTMLLIVAVHVALLAVVMSAKLGVQRHQPDPPLIVETIREPPPPPPIMHSVKSVVRQPVTQEFSNPPKREDLPPLYQPPASEGMSNTDPTPPAGGGAAVTPQLPPRIMTPVRSDAQLITPESELRPPYPTSKLLNEEQAVLTLRLTINDQGRVVAVDPVGRADPVFLDAARRHLLAHWRFKAATEDGRAVVSTKVITLRFELDS